MQNTKKQNLEIAGVTFTLAEHVEITADIARLEREEAMEQAELEWFAMMNMEL